MIRRKLKFTKFQNGLQWYDMGMEITQITKKLAREEYWAYLPSGFDIVLSRKKICWDELKWRGTCIKMKNLI